MKFQKNLLSLVLLFTAYVSFISYGAKAADNPEDKVLISVNGEDVYESDFDVSIKRMIREINDSQISDSEKFSQIKKLRADKRNEVVQAIRMRQEARANNIVITQEMINDFVVEKAGESLMTAEEYKDGYLKNEEMSELDFKEHVTRILERESLIDVKYKEKLRITEKERDDYMQKKPRLFQRHVPESVSLEYIEIYFAKYPVSNENKVQVETIANQIHTKAKVGDNFYNLLKKYPQTSVYRVNKGFTTILPASSSFPFAEVLSMAVGQVSDVIETQGKFIIFKVVNRVSSHEMTDLEIEEKASRLLLTARRRYLLQQYKLSLLNKASVGIIDESD